MPIYLVNQVVGFFFQCLVVCFITFYSIYIYVELSKAYTHTHIHTSSFVMQILDFERDDDEVPIFTALVG